MEWKGLWWEEHDAWGMAWTEAAVVDVKVRVQRKGENSWKQTSRGGGWGLTWAWCGKDGVVKANREKNIDVYCQCCLQICNFKWTLLSESNWGRGFWGQSCRRGLEERLHLLMSQWHALPRPAETGLGEKLSTEQGFPCTELLRNLRAPAWAVLERCPWDNVFHCLDHGLVKAMPPVSSTELCVQRKVAVGWLLVQEGTEVWERLLTPRSYVWVWKKGTDPLYSACWDGSAVHQFWHLLTPTHVVMDGSLRHLRATSCLAFVLCYLGIWLSQLLWSLS